MYDNVPVTETMREMRRVELGYQKQLAEDNSTWTEEQVNSVARKYTERDFGLR
jgi:hypothetical protein